MNKIKIFILLLILLFGLKLSTLNAQAACSGNLITLPNVEKKLLPASVNSGRPGDCMVPQKIVLHTTVSGMNALDTYNYFASGSEGRNVSSQFIVGSEGKILQLVELYDKTAEVAYAVAHYNQQAISIEMTYNGIFRDKISVPPAQYSATQSLVSSLMQQYHISVGNIDYNFTSASDSPDDTIGSGIFGHYQLNPESRIDPGKEFLKFFLQDLRSIAGSSQNNNTSSNNGLSGCVITKVGSPSASPTLPSSCQTSTTTGDGSPRGQKPPNYPTNLGQAIKDQFGITILGFDDSSDFMKWIWEKLWDIKGTNFASLVKGAIVKRTDSEISSQVGCPGGKTSYGGTESVILRAYPYGEAFFKYIFTHELGHVVRNCNKREKIRWDDVDVAAQKEGAVSYYGGHAAECTGSENTSENYADMVAYYLNPEAGIATASCYGKAPNTPPNPFFGSPVLKPFHLQIAKDVLN